MLVLWHSLKPQGIVSDYFCGLFLCVVGIALYAIPIGTLFDSFGAVLGLAGDEEEDDEVEETNCQQD